MNNVPAKITDPNEAAQALFKDARAQADAEKGAWPYQWFKHEKYAQASGRGTVKGRFVIKDSGNPNASAAGLWVGLIRQPHTIKGYYDFQKWLRPYQFLVQTESDGSFSIPNVLAGDNYTLWAYGTGAAGTFLSQEQAGGKPPLLYNLPAKPFNVKVTGGGAVDLGTITWTPTRVGATVFELGVPTRKADTFRHSEDFWSPEMSPKLGYPTPLWGGQMFFPSDFPDGMTYTVGKSRWTTDWNYVLPSLPDAEGIYQACTGTIHFDLAEAPVSGAKASLYIGCAGDDGGHVVISINGTDLATVPDVTAEPNPLTTEMSGRKKGVGGFDPSYSDNSSIHFGDHGPFSDERITFPAKLLKAGQNTLTITKNTRDLTCYVMVDYLRLELPGHVPPAPANVIAYAGKNQTLVCWSLVPGATSYNLLRSTTADSGYAPIASGLVGPVCGSGPSRMTYTDPTAANATQYFYAVQSVNPTGQSANSKASSGVTPSAKLAANLPATPMGVKVASSGSRKVALGWTASPGADYYSVWRTTLYEDGVGGNYPLRTILLDDATTGTSYTDSTPTDGKIYSYHVEATNAAGTSAASAMVTAKPLPPPPAVAPQSFAGKWTDTRNGPVATLNWSPVPGATGYVIYRSTQPDGPFQWPNDFVTTVVSTTYTDKNDDKKGAKVTDKTLVPTKDYYYRVTAVNVGGISPSATTQLKAK